MKFFTVCPRFISGKKEHPKQINQEKRDFIHSSVYNQSIFFFYVWWKGHLTFISKCKFNHVLTGNWPLRNGIRECDESFLRKENAINIGKEKNNNENDRRFCEYVEWFKFYPRAQFVMARNKWQIFLFWLIYCKSLQIKWKIPCRKNNFFFDLLPFENKPPFDGGGVSLEYANRWNNRHQMTSKPPTQCHSNRWIVNAQYFNLFNAV